MSAILGLFELDGAPADAALVMRMLRAPAMRLRGPDAEGIRRSGNVALGHALLRTTREAANERQPYTLDGSVWIVADARVDGRQDLLEALDDPRASLASPDCDVILRAYLRWGEACVERLLGDFAFAIWDGRSRHLFCARDHMGVKPFYYAARGRSVAIASAIQALRLHPAVSSRVNGAALMDFLVSGYNETPSTTTFADVMRLPPAHTLTASAAGVRLKRYWTLPIDEPQYRRHRGEYVEEFRSLVDTAVRDRLRTDRVSVFMSGGLDSTTLATTACEAMGGGAPVKAFSLHFERLFEDREPAYADLVARHLGIPIEYYAQDSRTEWFLDEAARLSEPNAMLTDPMPSTLMHAAMARHSRVALYGEGPDNALKHEWRSSLGYLWRQRRVMRMLADVGTHVWMHRRVPLVPSLPRIVRSRLRDRAPAKAGAYERAGADERAGTDAQTSPFQWLDPALQQRYEAHAAERRADAAAVPVHPVRPRAYASLQSPQWQWLFEWVDTERLGASMEVRHPYIDVRVLRFLLRLPVLPWCRDKLLMRRALEGRIPEVVRARPKTPLPIDPVAELVRRAGFPDTDHLESHSHPVVALSPTARIPMHVRLRQIALSRWLRAIEAERPGEHGRDERVTEQASREEALQEA